MGGEGGGLKKGAKLSGAKLSGAKLSYNQNQVPYFLFQTYTSPKMKNKKKQSFILMRTKIGFNLKCIAQCICSKSSGLTFLDNIQKLSSFHTQICSKMQF